MEKLNIYKQKPKKDEVILFKAKVSAYPEVGVFEIHDAIEEIYIPANDDVELLENVEWWMKIPQK